MQQKVTQRDLLNLKAGEEVTFYLPTELARNSARSTAVQTSGLHPRVDVIRYSCRKGTITEEGAFPLTVKAIPRYDEE